MVVTMLSDGNALRSVLLDHAGLEGMHQGGTLVDLSTVDVASSAAVAEEAAKHGVHYVRGAVSGTPAVVRSGRAGLLLSGPAAAREAAAALLRDLTATHVVVGEAEEARVVKLATNLLLGGTTQLLAEAVVMAEASGVDREVLLAALDSTVISSRFLTYKGTALRARDYGATFTTAGMRKDISLALDQAGLAGVPMVVTQGVRDQLDQACDRGWAQDDFLSLVRLVQAEAGQPVDEGAADD
jgi:3-hydroxyisobutyrate dehydrogenase-like beta-hydroxyacid dehydrogenase